MRRRIVILSTCTIEFECTHDGWLVHLDFNPSVNKLTADAVGDVRTVVPATGDRVFHSIYWEGSRHVDTRCCYIPSQVEINQILNTCFLLFRQLKFEMAIVSGSI